MSTTVQHIPTSRVQFGMARVDITPPVGIYHPMWGAARHHRATGIHRPLTAEIMAFAAETSTDVALVRVQIDLVGLSSEAYAALVQAVSDAANLPTERVVVAFSHTHAAGLFSPDREKLPGGELIQPYLQELQSKLRDTTPQAIAAMQPTVITYATGRCDLAGQRDYWDDERDLYACGFNPDAAVDDTVLVARVTDDDGTVVCTLVNYACHPTTLAWENTLTSPDYVGAMREAVEKATGAPCIFLLGACGELGPRQGYVGDTAIADQNGYQLGYAALSTLTAMDPPAQDFYYQGPVVSGATLGTWTHQAQSSDRTDQTVRFAGGQYVVDLPLKELPDPDALQAELADWQQRQQEADEQGDAIAARDYGARAERARRWLNRIQTVPEGDTFPFPYAVYRLGDAFWITVGGEPYSLLQTELRRRFPEHTLLVTPLAAPMNIAYLLPRDRYGAGLYQEEPSILAAGCLEQLIEAVAQRIEQLR